MLLEYFHKPNIGEACTLYNYTVDICFNINVHNFTFHSVGHFYVKTPLFPNTMLQYQIVIETKLFQALYYLMHATKTGIYIYEK